MKFYGKPKNGYVRTLPYYKIPFFKLCSSIQLYLWKKGFTIKYNKYIINIKFDWHIPWFGGQCTPDFSCCRDKV